MKAPILKAMWTGLSERDETADVCMIAKGKPEADSDQRDTESIPLKEDIKSYFKREILPHVPDVWIDEGKTKVGYEIPFTRQFYKYVPLRDSNEILNEIKRLEDRIQTAIAELFE